MTSAFRISTSFVSRYEAFVASDAAVHSNCEKKLTIFITPSHISQEKKIIPTGTKQARRTYPKPFKDS